MAFDPNASFASALNRVPPRLVEAVSDTMSEAIARYFRENGVERVADQERILGAALFTIAGRYGFRNRMRAFVEHRDLAGITRVAAAMAAGALHAAGGELSDLTDIFGSALDEARRQFTAGDAMNETVLDIDAFNDEASPDPADPETAAHEELMLHILDKHAETNARLSEMQRELARLQAPQHATEEQQAELDDMRRTVSMVPDIARELGEWKSQGDLRDTKARLEDFIQYVEAATSETGQAFKKLRREMVEEIAAQSARLQTDPAATRAVHDEVAQLRRNFDAALDGIRSDATAATATVERRLAEQFNAEFASMRREMSSVSSVDELVRLRRQMDEQTAALRAEIDSKMRAASSQQTGASPATRQRLSSVEAHQTHMTNEVRIAAANIATVRDDAVNRAEMQQHEARALRERLDAQSAELRRFNAAHDEVSQLKAEMASVRFSMDKIARDFSTALAESMRDMREFVSQSMPRQDASVAPPRGTFASSTSDATAEALSDAALMQRRREHDRLESKGTWRADFIAQKADLARVFNELPVTYSWLKAHASNAQMVPTLRILGKTLLSLESKSPRDLLDDYFARMREKNWELVAEDVQKLRIMLDACGGSAESRVAFIEEMSLRLDGDTKVSERADLLKMLFVARQPGLDTLSAPEFEKALSGERAIDTVGGHDVRMSPRKNRKTGFQ